MKRIDLYILGLALLHFVLFFGVMSFITAGAGLSLMGEQSGIGYFCIILFIVAFVGIFYNLSMLLPIIAIVDEEKAFKEVMRVGRGILLILVAYTLLEFLQALSYFSSYQT